MLSSRNPVPHPLRLAAFLLCTLLPAFGATFDVKSYGARGDGKTLDTPAINQAIEAAAAAGGGTVVFPAGNYLSFSIHLKSNVTLYLGEGSTLTAAEPTGDGKVGYDYPEPNPNDPYEDFGHSHWHNSLIWGEDLQNIGITGPGTIYGFGLQRGFTHAVRDLTPEEHAKLWAAVLRKFHKEPDGRLNAEECRAVHKAIVRHTDPELNPFLLPDAANAAKPGSIKSGPFGYPSVGDTMADGVGNKAIALKNCRNVTLRDFTIYHGGHFGILAIATDNMTIDNLKIDTNRDGMDIDCCVNVVVSNCTVNSPWDDGICLKSCFALGKKRACENITITNCHVSGYLEGSLLDGTRKKVFQGWEVSGGTGRIKFGTESNGGYKNIAVSNCTFDYCRGLALEIVDGGTMEDVSVTNLTLRDVQNSAIYVRLGERNREPSTPPGFVRRISISNVVAYNVDPRYSSIIEGSPDRFIEDLSLSNIRIAYAGGGTQADAQIVPHENLKSYPEPEAHGTLPVYGFFIRHVKDIEMHDIKISYLSPDARPAFGLQDVAGAEFRHVNAEHAQGVPVYTLNHVSDFVAKDVAGLADTAKAQSEHDTL